MVHQVLDAAHADTEEGFAGVDEFAADRVDDLLVLRGDLGEAAGRDSLVLEAEVDDRVGVAGGLAQPVEVGQVPASGLGAHGPDGRCRLVGTGEADDVVTCVDELGNNGGADVARWRR